MKTPSSEIRLKVRERPQFNPIHFQKWMDLLFLHWEFDPQELQKFLPKGLHIDTFGGRAYVGIIPFFMRDIKPTWFGRKLPGLNFYELNVRTYVFDDEGTPGVWFFSLEASNWFAVLLGQMRFHLPYFHSKFEVEQKDGWTDFQCTRTKQEKAIFKYKAGDLIGPASPESLEFFLLERYLLFSSRKKGGLFKVLVHHEPYQMYEPLIEYASDQPLIWNGLLPMQKNPLHRMVSKGVNVDVFPIQD